MGIPLAIRVAETSTVENPTVALMMRRAFPELAAAVEGQSARILERFRGMVKDALPSADELTLTELVDHLPQVLEDLAGALAAVGGTLPGNFLNDSRQHGVCRYHQSFNLSELLVEYSILRSLVMEEVTGALDRALALEEISALNAGLDAASRRAVESFVSYFQREVQAGAEAQSKYLSFLSHDLRGSLNGILLTVEVLRREQGGSAEHREFVNDLDLMRQSILDTVSGMERFLHADKFRRGKVEVKLSTVNLEALIHEVAAQFTEQAKEKGVEIAVETGNCPEVESDRELVQLILQNLLGNAVKYTKQGFVRISTHLLDRGKCRITVAYDGPGIPREQMGQIFQPYMRGPTHGQSGLGLGLTIAHEAAVLLKARLWAESQPGQGSKFHLELPG
jgi:signal transduction histidine kinase